MSHPAVAQVVVVLPGVYVERPPEWLSRLLGDRLVLVPGGDTRARSVRAGLAALPRDVHLVLVHDAARPFVSRSTIDAVLGRVRAGVGAIAALPVSDTLKEVEDGRIVGTVARDRLWRAQTPQGFPRHMLESAYARLGDRVPTDDAALCEAAGFPVEVVLDGSDNVKVTTAEDFRLAEALARESR
jgi:2-C-methyl-D-erythritol 4-phosphate cytidylyltransferase